MLEYKIIFESAKCVRVEVIADRDFIQYGGEVKSKEAGAMRGQGLCRARWRYDAP